MIKDERQFLHVAVIGAGLGGLSAAISLAAEGFKVSVFEKNDKAGGKLNVLRRQGFSFDLGPSILTMPQIFQSLFEQAGRRMEDYAAIEEIKPHWRNFFEDGTVIDLTPDVRDMERELQKLPPDESDGFFGFLEYSRKLTKITEEGYFAKGLDTFWELINFYGPLRSLLRFDVWRNMDQGVRRFVKNPKLIDILNYFIKYVGSSPYDAPALLNLLPYIQFGYGLWYVKGGMYNLALGLERLLGELGGELHYGVRVSRIETEGSRATGLVLSDGRRVQADLIVSNMEVIPAYTDLL
jgi:diapolycopene oxygenase